ncbi:unnamed protein product [Callosobruchus maculatus]|uniref:Protein SDA1 n=1 Tax=Callosobruchus maculatus TaxID=64391 RepID=A0A653BPA7_CALMS|nr:unnamed protein product [Callosobruchus maculatus]
MKRKNNNQLPENLPQLQNLIKRDPQSYHEEFMQQYQHLQNTIQVFSFSPQSPNKTLEDLVIFMAQIAHCYPKELESFPEQVVSILKKYNTILDSNTRMMLCKALVLLRNKNLIGPTDILELFFSLLKCQDRALRKFLENHLVTDIKNLNAKHKNNKLNTTLQNYMYMVLGGDTKAAKIALDIMVELYKKNIWNDARTVNVIAKVGCFSKNTKILVGSLKFFLGKDPEEEEENSDSDNEIYPKEVMMANKVNKKTRKREKQLTKAKKLAAKAYKKKSAAPTFNFSALHLIHDPQGMAEKLFQQLEMTNKRFEVKLMTLDVISRLIGLHNLFLFNFYPYILRFLQPHQREVTRMLQFCAQASHELLPPDVLEPVLRKMADNFVTERNSSDVIAIGLNAMKEVCARCPLAMTEDLMRTLVDFKTHRERSVIMAARSLIQLFRNIRPEILHRKDRGKPTEAMDEIESLNYGKLEAKDYIPGAEVLLEEKKSQEDSGSESGCESEGEWIDVSASDDETLGNLDEEEEEEGSDSDSEGNGENNEESKDNGEEHIEKEQDEQNGSRKSQEDQNNDENKGTSDKETSSDVKIPKAKKKEVDLKQKKELAHKVTKQMQSTKKGMKRKLEEKPIDRSSELVKLSDIENIYKKRKHDKQARVDSVRKGQVDREKFGYQDRRANEHCSKTNKEKKKKKNFQMMRHKARNKTKRSFKDKQIALRNHLLKLKKMK